MLSWQEARPVLRREAVARVAGFLLLHGFRLLHFSLGLLSRALLVWSGGGGRPLGPLARDIHPQSSTQGPFLKSVGVAILDSLNPSRDWFRVPVCTSSATTSCVRGVIVPGHCFGGWGAVVFVVCGSCEVASGDVSEGQGRLLWDLDEVDWPASTVAMSATGSDAAKGPR